MVTGLIVDASVSVGWMLEDEENELLSSALMAVRQEGALVPLHWHFEIRNALLMSVRRRRLSEAGLAQRLAWLDQLDIRSDHESHLGSTLSLAIEYGLTFHDALYLELSNRRQFPLATLDDDLARAARAIAVDVYSA
jgi:predicted nucleic acid-binding protein